MEKNADTIEKKEFDDVWTRVSGRTAATAASPDALLLPIGAESGERSRALDALSKTSSTLGGLVSNVLTKKENSVKANRENTETPPSNPTRTPPRETLPDTKSSSAAASRAAAARLVTQSEADRLLSIMSATAQTARECQTLSSQLTGDARRTCRSMEQTCRATISELNAQYYILTGLRSCPGSVIAQTATASERLSAIIDTEGAVCEACSEAANETAIASLQNAYTHAASASERVERAAGQLLWSLSRT